MMFSKREHSIMFHNICKLCLFIVGSSLIIKSSYGNPTDKEVIGKLAIANNMLGLNLFQLLAKDSPGNVFFSPFSLSNAFGMLFAGAKRNTAEQLRSVLGYNTANLPSDKVPPAFNKYLQTVLPKDQEKDPAYVLNLANELLVSKNYNVSSQYKKDVQHLFHAYLKEVDFTKNSVQIVQEVNNWVKEQTHGKIDKLLSDLDPSTVLLILNAIYFKGNWKFMFDKKLTKPQKFYNDGLDSKAKDVPLMHMTAKLPYTYAYNDDVQALGLPYQGQNISMVVLLPGKRDGLKNFESSITHKKLMDIQRRMRATKVIVTFPKFKVKYERQMVPDFKALGAKDVFAPGIADLSGITPNNSVYVSEVVHKAAIEVNEEGSEAAAATGIHIVPYAMPIAPPPRPPEFTADHPFMFAILDTRNDLMLFLGRVTEL